MLLSTFMHFDLRDYPIDGPLPELPPRCCASAAQTMLIELARARQPTIRQLYMRMVGARGHRQIYGTPARSPTRCSVVRQSAADGFNIMPPVSRTRRISSCHPGVAAARPVPHPLQAARAILSPKISIVITMVYSTIIIVQMPKLRLASLVLTVLKPRPEIRGEAIHGAAALAVPGGPSRRSIRCGPRSAPRPRTSSAASPRSAPSSIPRSCTTTRWRRRWCIGSASGSTMPTSRPS